MKGKARLIYKSFNTCFRTFLPVYFYGMPNAKMIVLFTREKADSLLHKEIEWVVASHLDFWYDYESDTIFDFKNRELDFEEFIEYVDKLEQRIRHLKSFGHFSNYKEAQQFYNGHASKMLFDLNPVSAIMQY
ncbi:MAG: hypothetical protein JXR61_06755 [Prolixibacteraceae bacterium]|nr:hypothetical protein [Prolixibacteraceae bacterium]